MKWDKILVVLLLGLLAVAIYQRDRAQATTWSSNLPLDNDTWAVNTIDYAHHEIHSGSHYVATDIDTDVDVLSPKYWQIKTPNTTKWAHLIGSFYADASGTWAIYENPTLGGDGTGLTEINSNRNSANTATTFTYFDPTVNADGTLIWTWYVGVAGNPTTQQGGGGSRDHEFILKQNEDYVIKFTPDADNTLAEVEFLWYEHTDKAAP